MSLPHRNDGHVNYSDLINTKKIKNTSQLKTITYTNYKFSNKHKMKIKKNTRNSFHSRKQTPQITNKMKTSQAHSYI